MQKNLIFFKLLRKLFQDMKIYKISKRIGNKMMRMKKQMT